MSGLFLFASLGVINGILLSIYLFTKKPKRLLDIYFGGLILSLCIRIGKSVLVHFDRDVDKLILQIGLSACVFIGPFFYLYARSLQDGNQIHKKKDSLLLIILAIAVIAVGILMPYRTEPDFWNTYMVKGIYLVWAAFVLMGLYHTRSVFAQLFKSPLKLNEEGRYVLGIALSVLFITITYQIALFIDGYTYIWGSIIFSISFYYLAGRKLVSKKALTPKSTQAPLENASELFQKVERLMTTQKPFINPKLKLDDLAAEVGISRHNLSRVLNEEYHHGFSQYVKEHRVNEAKQLIEVRNELSLEGIGFEAGFNSKSAFFEAFKKVTELTPSAYKKSISAKK
ncbi:AraC family transcriptional regulator [Roseivirga sp. E12]|uniref:helix-turn-helix domain-containing protein n=1 Tax=Roseivirga sp. E12 TaxID=2819237 RepID=UPI001ABC2160|nr:helix-turn-helix domain-containing protein [Roseivirga sp. E12]MBO3697933.1 AraC family transcriptional regulator [Roseivirga sp. E12]